MQKSILENEIKLKLEDEDAARELIGKVFELYNKKPEKFFQRDEYYDTKNWNLKEQDLVVRLREFNENFKFALKGPRNYKEDGSNERVELEFETSDVQKMREQLNSQGLELKDVIEKVRYKFDLGDGVLVVDQLPHVGFFVEIEGSSDMINKAREELGLDQNKVIKGNYGEVLDEKLKVLGLLTDKKEVTFDKALARWQKKI